MPSAATLKFRFSVQEAATLNTPANGEGGFQTLIRQLQAAYDPAARTIDMSDAMIGKVVPHLSYKPGGFEGRLATAFVRNIRNYMEQ